MYTKEKSSLAYIASEVGKVSAIYSKGLIGEYGHQLDRRW